MSSPDSNIRSAFTARLLILPGLPPVAWESKPFTPAGVPYLAPALVTGEPVQAGQGSDSLNLHVGFYQVSIYAPAGKGVLEINTLRDAIIDHFKRGVVLAHGGQSLTIQKAFAGPTLPETDWIQLPITIRYKLLAEN